MPKSRPNPPPGPEASDDSFERFERVATAIFAVPKDEMAPKGNKPKKVAKKKRRDR